MFAAVLGGALAGLVAPLRSVGAWTALAGGLCAAALALAVTTPRLLAAPPAGRRARRWLANAHQAAALLLIGLGIRAIDRWWATPPEARTWLLLAVAALASLGYASVRLGMTARFLRPGPEWHGPGDAPVGGPTESL